MIKTEWEGPWLRPLSKLEIWKMEGEAGAWWWASVEMGRNENGGEGGRHRERSRTRVG